MTVGSIGIGVVPIQIAGTAGPSSRERAGFEAGRSGLGLGGVDVVGVNKGAVTGVGRPRRAPRHEEKLLVGVIPEGSDVA